MKKRPLLDIFSLLLIALVPLPLVVVLAVSVSPDPMMSFPPSSFSLVWYEEMITSGKWGGPFLTSVFVGLVAAFVTTAAALGTALALEQTSPSVRNTVEMLILAPLIFPHAAIGVAMFGLLTAVHLRSTLLGITIVHMILCVPFAYRPIAASFHKLDRSLAEAAMNLGATPGQVLRRVTLPTLRPAIITSLLFAFITSFDEVTVTLFLISNNSVSTLPLQIYKQLEESANPTVAAVAALLIIAAFVCVLVLKRYAGLKFFVRIED